MDWSSTEREQYSRHFLLDQVGEAGQAKLKAARVLVVGAGGLGCPILQYLTAAGVGHIGIIDPDQVDRSNLQRQILYTTDDIGQPKATAAQQRLQALNPHLDIRAYPYALDTRNALDLIAQYDLVVDGSDNFPTRYLVNDACVLTGKPLVYGSMYKFEGQVAVFNYKGGTTYRCLFPTPPAPGDVPNCSEVGVLGALAGIIGTWQATEALKIILEIGEVLSGKLLLYQALSANVTVLEVPHNPEARAQVEALRDQFTTHDYGAFCGLPTAPASIEISPADWATQGVDYAIVDVRELWEQPRPEALEGMDIPLPRLLLQAERIPRDRPVLMVCAKGIRSRIAVEQLQEKLGYTNVYNLTGGIKAWTAYQTGKSSNEWKQ